VADPQPQAPPLTRATLAQSTAAVLRAATRTKPAILLVRDGTRRLVVKDFAPTAWHTRAVYGRWVIGHETRIYARLAGVEGVPAFHRRLDTYALAVEYVEGETLKDLSRQEIETAVFDRLAELFDRLHARGVVHLDSHQKTNILLTPDGRPYLLDFATALYLGRGWFGQRVLLPLFGGPDRWGILKLKNRYHPAALTEAERRRLHRGRITNWLWPPQWFRALGRLYRRLTGARDHRN